MPAVIILKEYVQNSMIMEFWINFYTSINIYIFFVAYFLYQNELANHMRNPGELLFLIFFLFQIYNTSPLFL